MSEDLDSALRDGARVLAAAGIDSARTEVELLAAHLLGVTRGGLTTRAALGDRAPNGLAALVDRRAGRVPLQHLIGTAPFRGLELAVGPGVFVPRPETEQVAEVAITAAREVVDRAGQADRSGAADRSGDVDRSGAVDRSGSAVVVDLCTGSGAIALAVWSEVPDVVVHAVELDARAYEWARRNLGVSSDGDAAGGRAGVHLVRGDARTALSTLDGTVDVVVSNPPYVPPDAVPRDPEVRDHDPAVALYGLGPDGLTVARGIVGAATRLLRPGGVLVMEHAEVQAVTVREIVVGTRAFAEVRTRQDLAGRDRMVVARRTRVRDAAVTDTALPGTALPGDGASGSAVPGGDEVTAVKDSRP